MSLGLVSIVVPYYNCELYLTRLIESIQNQKYSDFECILVDDGSRDGSFSVVDLAIQRDPRFRNVSRPLEYKSGGRGAKNYGFSLCKGSYIVFFDADDVMYSDFLEKRIKLLSDQLEFGCAYSDMGWKVKPGEHKRIFRYNIELQKDFKAGIKDDNFWLHYIDLRFYFPPGNFMWRRQAIEGKKLWDESTTIGEDYEFHCRKFLEGVLPGHIATSTWDYMANPNSMIATSEAILPLLGRSHSKSLVNLHLYEALGFRKNLIRKELTWQVKILRRIVSSNGTINEKFEAIQIIFGRIWNTLEMLNYKTATKLLLISMLRISVYLHLYTSRFYSLYSIIIPDKNKTDKVTYFSIS